VIVATLAVTTASGACRPKPPDEADYVSRITSIRTEKDAALRRSNDPIPDDRKADLLPLSYFPIDPNYSVPAQLRSAPAKGDESGQQTGRSDVVLLPTSTGTSEQASRVGQLEFTLAGRPLKLTAFASGDVGLFVPFRDLTSGTESYPAGRYLNIERSPTGVYELDFNKAYNPYCYYNPTYTCPLPPPENRLDVHVRAGETIRPDAEH
jgi:uncharacterized protein (DUF1684 family)